MTLGELVFPVVLTLGGGGISSAEEGVDGVTLTKVLVS